MKKIIFSVLIFLGLCSLCKAQDGFHITGQLGGSLEGKLILVNYTPEGFIQIGETEMKDGNFEFTGSVPTPGVAYIMTDKKQLVATLMIDNREFTLTAGANGIDVVGGENQTIWNQFEAAEKMIAMATMKRDQEFQIAYAQRNQTRALAAHQEYEKIVKNAIEKEQELLKTYADTYIAAYVVAAKAEQLNMDQLAEWYNLLGEKAKATFYGKFVDTRLGQYRNVTVGGIAPDFEAPLADGGSFSLYGTKAKVKLIDFWASWCNPCRQENKNLPKIYKKYQKKGLEIISFSLDNKKQAWLKAIKEDNMTWINVSDLKGSASGVANLYSVKAIPQTLLLDEKNRIIARNLRGKALEKKIAEVLGKK